MNNYCVYCHTSPSGKKYVGISNDPKKRWSNGNGYKKNYLFYRAINKYGWDNIQHTILYSNVSFQEAEKIEAELIEKWNLLNPKFGYNLKGHGANSLSDYTRQLMSNAQKDNKNSVGRTFSADERARISASLKLYYKTHGGTFLGRKHSPETIDKLRKRKISEEAREKMRKPHPSVSGGNNPSARKVIQLDSEGNVIAKYYCAKHAALKLNCDLSSIIKCCRGKMKSCAGYKWRYQ